MESLWKIGIDIGSTTIKMVALEDGEPVYQHYARHFSEIGAALNENLEALKRLVGARKFTFALTGSAGMGIAQRIHLPFVQEVIACAAAVRTLIPQTDTVVELGGEDAKITYFGDAPEQRMNGVCAGGTGSFIDHMASLLSTDATGLNELAKKGEQIYTIASRCGVFAKTDVQALMNDGASKADIALSVFQAVVNQTIGNLAQGRAIQGNVAFLGGPLHFLPVLKQRFIETLNLPKECIVPVEEGNYFVAMGAALSDEAKEITVEALEESIAAARAAVNGAEAVDFTLFEDADDYRAFKQRHDAHKVRRGELSSYEDSLYIGIDAGSTTTKIVAIGQDKEILYTSYGSNFGSPLKTVVDEMKRLYQSMPKRAKIAGVMTTGYGEAIVKAALHADMGEVETFAHLRAAQEFCPEVSFVLDIGGQDMKCFFVKDGTIGNITLNEACSAGCGSFLQNFAEGLHMTAAEFAEKAIGAKAPVDLGTRCTVFMNSKVKQAQKERAEVSDISAGIALSVIKNALFKVLQLKDVDELGDNIVVQGGTFYNDAVLRSMEKLLGREVIRPDIAGLMGAYGAAILAMEAGLKESMVLPAEALENFEVKTNSYRCNQCGNKCLITKQKFPDGGSYFTGNRCERGIGGKPKTEAQKSLNIYRYKYDRLFRYYHPLEHPSRGEIGIPRTLNMYEDYPFWFTFFTFLGYRVVLSDDSSAKLYYKGMATVPSDSLCYPAKLAHGHVMDLVEKGLKKIFYPCAPFTPKDEVRPSDNHFNCPIVASYAENIRGNMDVLREQNVQFMQPFLPLDDKKRMVERLTEEFAVEGIKEQQIATAVEAAYIELSAYRADVRHYGEKILRKIEETGEPAILLAGRPYHIDPEINHGIPEMIQSYHLPILSEDAVYHLPVKEERLQVVNQWSYHARLYHAAHFVAEHPNITMIQFSSFGCGLDALTTGEAKDILERHQRIYTMIKLDEVSNLGAARIRLRSLMAALARKKAVPYAEMKPVERPRFTADCKKTHTILAPQMAPIHFDLIQTVLHKHGYQVVIPDLPDKAAIDLGLRYVNNDMCYPAIVVIGQMLSALKSGQYDPDHTSIMLFQTCGACRATNYLAVLRQALKYAGYPQVAVFACSGLPDETDAFEINREMLVDVIKAGIYGDLLMRMRNRMRPYELVRGSVDRMFKRAMERAKEELVCGGYFKYRKLVKRLVQEFDNMPIKEDVKKPKVGVVGEILVKYHPVANNHLEDVLLEEGAEAVMPDFVDFFLYTAYDAVAKYKLLAGSYKDQFFAKMFIQAIEFYRRPMRRALRDSKHFLPPKKIEEIAELAERHVSIGNMAGEGWFLTGEMVKLIEEGAPNIVCLQPFGCLPNHITGKGVLHSLRKSYRAANIVAIDCDAGSSEVNQLNRIKLMLATAKERVEGKTEIAK